MVEVFPNDRWTNLMLSTLNLKEKEMHQTSKRTIRGLTRRERETVKCLCDPRLATLV